MDVKKIEKKLYKVISTYRTINIADSFVINANKLENTTGHGERKLYIGNENKELRSFFGKKGFEVDCYFEKENLEQFMSQIKTEYLFPQQNYRASNISENQLSTLYLERLNKVNNLERVTHFKIKEQDHLKSSRVYINSKDDSYNLLRELTFDEICKVVVYKVTTDLKNFYYIFHLYVDYESKFGDVLHPTIIREEEQIIQNSKEIPATEKLNLTVSRVGQGDFRKNLLNNSLVNFCPLTEVSRQDILIASHIKPWSVSNNKERLDINNGLLLTPTFDKLFDKGLITFNEKKELKISSYLDDDTRNKLNISEKVIPNLPIKGREKYLKYHNENIFKKI